MFARSLVNRLAAQAKGFMGCGVTARKCHGLQFGDARMPDKLYKTVELEMKSVERAVLDSYKVFVTSAAKEMNIPVGKVFSSKKYDFHRYTVLKSVHVYRKHLVQYEIRTHYVWVHLHRLTGSTADTFIEFIERMLPESVALKVTRIAVEPLPEHLNPESVKEATTAESSTG